MVRFSCFPSHIHHPKTKKAVPHNFKEILSGVTHRNLPKSFLDGQLEPCSAKMDCNLSNSTPELIASPSFECCWKSEDLNGNFCTRDDIDSPQNFHLKKSQSVGSGLDRGGLPCVLDSEHELCPQSPFNDSTENNCDIVPDNLSQYISRDSYDKIIFSSHEYQNSSVHTFEINDDSMHHESLFSIGDLKQSERALLEDSCEHSLDEQGDVGCIPWNDRCLISKSQSMPSFSISAADGGEELSYRLMGRSRSLQDLQTLSKSNQHSYNVGGYVVPYSKQKFSPCKHGVPKSANLVENKMHSMDLVEVSVLCTGQKEEDAVIEPGRCKYDDKLNERDHSQAFDALLDGWRDPVLGGKGAIHEHQKEPSQKLEQLTAEEFKTRRIEDWLSQIDFHDNASIQEIVESSGSSCKAKELHQGSGTIMTKVDAKTTPGMEAAYNYIASLPAVSTSAQMVNLGLVVIPSLNVFTSLRSLNLSRNFIVRIIAGTLPRSLQTLNLSKNNISSIEGLRDLTHLRTLDLSFNRLLRIGHGLAACSAMKELYLAGNKISEVEGLHRLLKLNIIDLSFNKISTAKCLGQLAANYGTLQSLNLEGNPAQRNVGDEQLKRYLLSVLPHLAYINRHAIKSSTKEISDRSSRSSTSHQFDRSLRSDLKRSRRGPSSAHNKSSLSGYGKSSQVATSLSKQSRVQHAPLPPMVSRPQPFVGVDNRMLSLRSTTSMRRSRSEGNL